MSIAANLPPRAKRLSLRLVELGVAVPPRVTAFLDGPEVGSLEGALAWGIEDVYSDSKLQVRWASGRLPDLLDVALERGHADPARFLPLATIGKTHMFAVDTQDPALAVHLWDAENGFTPWAEDFDGFTRKLRRRGEPSPSEKLEQALETARERDEAGDPSGVRAILLPAIARFPSTLGENAEGRDELGEAYYLLGKVASDPVEALARLETAHALGSYEAGIGLLERWLATGQYEQLVATGERMAPEHSTVRLSHLLGLGYLHTRRPRLALRAYHEIFETTGEDRAELATVTRELAQLREAPGVDREVVESILGWLDASPPHPNDELATLRTWWRDLPSAVRAAIVEDVTLADESAPTDAELARIARITDLSVTEAELTDLAWIAPLVRLDDLDVTDNAINDLSPLATLPGLTRLDVSNNNVTSLRALAGCTQLRRLVVDSNPLGGLEGLEQLHELEELHACEAGLESLEPLRGLPGLTEISIYENQIADLSPLATCPRLKEISCFTNPIRTGLAALGALPWLESVDAGDDSTVADVRALRAANAFVSIDSWSPDDEADNVEVVHPPDPTVRAWWDALPRVWQKAFLEHVLYSSKAADDDELHGLLRADSISISLPSGAPPLGDLEPLRRLVRVTHVNVERAGITDLSPVARLPRLRDLIVRDNKIDLVSLAPAEHLEELSLERCGVSSLIGLERCRALRELHAMDNHVDDLRPLAELRELRVLDLEGNQVSNLAPLAGLARLHTLELGLTRITDLAPLAGCTALRDLEIWGTPRLANARVLAELPRLSRVISHGSIPAADLAELRRLRPALVID